MAPEILFGEEFDSSVDIWSMGVILFYMVYGQLPFQARSRNELLTMVKSSFKVPENIQISDICLDLLKKMINPNP